MAQAEYKLAKENLASTDTLYRIGQLTAPDRRYFTGGPADFKAG